MLAPLNSRGDSASVASPPPPVLVPPPRGGQTRGHYVGRPLAASASTNQTIAPDAGRTMPTGSAGGSR